MGARAPDDPAPPEPSIGTAACMAALTYRITILGCRVNHAEAREIESVLVNRGLRRARGSTPADLEVVHTCSVTHAAAAKSRHAVRRAWRRGWSGSGGSGQHGADALDAPRRDGPRSVDPVSPVVLNAVSRAAFHAVSNSDSSPGPPANHRLDLEPWTGAVMVTGCYVATNAREAAALVGGSRWALPHESGDGSTLLARFARQVDAWLTRREAPPCLRRRPDPSSHAQATRRTPPRGAGRTGARTRRRVAREAAAGAPGRDRAAGPRSPYPFPPPAASPAPSIIRLPVTSPTARSAHVRAELRLQDGCDAACTFCIIPRIRRTLRSKSIMDVVSEARALVEFGHLEIVLTGVFLGAYGHETALRRRQARRGAPHLADVIDAVAGVRGIERVRLSSLEPGDVDGVLLDAMVANTPVVVPHLHLPLQSGSDRVLRRMNRQYRVGEYLEMIDRVNEALTWPGVPDALPPAITTDVICGFPGETDDDFARTREVAEQVGFLHMHVFPFSARAGTAAARWRDRFVDERVKRRRVRELLALETDPDHGLSIRARRRLAGRVVRVILEQPDHAEPGVMTGRCDHYTLVHIRTDRPRGTVVRTRITAVSPSQTIGVPVATVPAGLPLPVLRPAPPGDPLRMLVTP